MKSVKRIKPSGFLFMIALIIVLSCTRKTEGRNIMESFTTYPISTNADLDVLMKEIGDKKVVLLGEASHGTAEYYNWRTEISKRLIKEKGFNFIAVEGEWADSYRVNNFIKGAEKDSAATVELLKQYDRWPTWMWANHEVANLVTWLNKHNQQQTDENKAGFFGLDVYCLWESMSELMPYLQEEQPSLIPAANKVHNCFKPFGEDAQEYAIAVSNAQADCRNETSELWESISNWTAGTTASTMKQFVMEQNALVALNGERYYRAMVNSSSESWNVRDQHMNQTLDRLLEFHGPDAKAIVWEHNTHVGDARYTDMANAGMVNVGQLVREKYGEENVYIVGFGSYKGSVIAADAWGARIEKMNLPKARKGSWEDVLHKNGKGDQIILSKDLENVSTLKNQIGHRAVGVVYNPYDEYGNYVPTIIPKRYDAFFFIDNTTALHPIKVTKRNEPPDTYPSGY